jgi:hypothetical protein
VLAEKPKFCTSKKHQICTSKKQQKSQQQEWLKNAPSQMLKFTDFCHTVFMGSPISTGAFVNDL